jgi:hypothetical protein
MNIPEPGLVKWGESWWSWEQVQAIAGDGAELRRAVRAMTALLKGREWAEHVSRDHDIAELEAEITELVGKTSDGVAIPAKDQP